MVGPYADSSELSYTTTLSYTTDTKIPRLECTQQSFQGAEYSNESRSSSWVGLAKVGFVSRAWLKLKKTKGLSIGFS